MAASGQKFASDMSVWVKTTIERMRAVRNLSVERMVEVMQTPVAKGGAMPVDTGFLRSSLMFTAGQPLTLSRPNPNPDAPKGSLDTYSGQELTVVLLGADLKTPIYATYTANYARFQEYGSRGRAGRRFVGLAVQQWPRIVAEVTAEAKARTSPINVGTGFVPLS